MTQSLIPLVIQMLVAGVSGTFLLLFGVLAWRRVATPNNRRRNGIQSLLTGALIAVFVGLDWLVISATIGLRVFDGPSAGLVANLVTFSEAAARTAVLVIVIHSIWSEWRK